MVSKATIRFVELEATDILNLTSPRYIPEVSKNIDVNLWWSETGEKFRDWMEAIYIQRFNEGIGHYTLLEESVQKEGFRNPVIITAGTPLYWPLWMVPPNIREPNSQILISEYLGGSRLLVAQKHKMKVPCIVNDTVNRFKDSNPLTTPEAILAHFNDPADFTVRITDKGANVKLNKWYHIEDDSYDMKRQQKIRFGVIDEINQELTKWKTDTKNYEPPIY